jgi:glycosyltransferase involved in cell wall biosynthesis
MAGEPRVSVIVVAPELNDFGRRCLARLLALRDAGESFELIFVPDAAAGLDELDGRVVVVASGADVTTGRKRQIGLERARGEFVALLDDDAYPHRSWLRVALAIFDADESVAAVAGPTLTPPDDSELELLGGRVYASPLVSGPARWRYDMVDARDVDDAPSVNLVVRRSEAEAVGFDSHDRWGEDTLFCEGLLRRGGRIRYDPAVIVYHSRRPLWRAHLRQLYRWSRHRSAYARSIGGNSLRPAYFAPSALLMFLLAGPLLSGAPRRAWTLGALVYALACLAAGADPRPGRWIRVSGGIVATHLVYGSGFLAGLAGAKPVRR